MKGKVAIITGSTSGMGKAIADKLGRSGCNVLIHGICDDAVLQRLRVMRFGSWSATVSRQTRRGAWDNTRRHRTGNSKQAVLPTTSPSVRARFGGRGGCELMQKQVEELRQNNVEVMTSDAQLLDPAAIRAMVAAVHDRFGRVDILVNNAGIQHVAPIHEFPDAKWDALLGVMLSAPFHATKAVLPHMLDKGWGRIVNTCSFHGTVASPFKAPYVAAKHGVAGFTKAVALEVAKSGITVNAVCPGYVLTELVEKQLHDSARTRGITPEQVVNDILLKPQPIGRFVKVEEVAAFVHYLCSDDAAAITGAVLPIDGGWTAQ